MTNEDGRQPNMIELLETVATHEAGHAVMRWVRGLPCTAVGIRDDGGYCAATGKRLRAEDLLLVLLAGFAAESGYGLFEIDFESSVANDFDRAREILNCCERLRWSIDANGTVSLEPVTAALRRHTAGVCDLLMPHVELVESIAGRLMADTVVSARSVAALCREHERRLIRAQSDDTEACAR